MEGALDRDGRADERGQLQVLVRKFGEFDAAVSPLELVTERRHLHRAEGVNAALLPHAIQGLEPCRAELSRGRSKVQIAVWRRADQLGPDARESTSRVRSRCLVPAAS